MRWFNNRFLQHFVFWAAHYLFYALLYGGFEDKYLQTFIQELLYLPMKVIFTYLVMYWVLPKYLLAGKYTSFVVWFTLLSFAAGLVQRLLSYTIDYPMYNPVAMSEPFMFLPRILKGIVGIYPVTFVAVAIKLVKISYANQQAQQVLTQEKLEAELKFLKTQIHPHFLFNTLNNLYALTLKKSELAPGMVLKLSELINYMLYECKEDKVPLNKEIKFINNYIDIERLRYGDKLDVDIRIRGDVADKTIAPLIMLPFVENCFKHGASLELDQSWVKVDIAVEPDSLVFKVENNKVAGNGHSNGAGIGIANARRRLALIYPGKHDLKIINGEGTFLVILTINEN